MINTKIIKHKLITKELTQKQLANILEINTQTLNNWLQGKNLKNIITFLKLMQYLDINVNEILKKEP